MVTPAGIPAGVANGYLGSLVATIPGGNGRQLRIDLIPQTVALMAAFEARFGVPLRITDGYRDFAGQVAAKAAKGIYAATPGTSNHGWGQALDLGSGVQTETSTEYRWMKENGPRFGWFHPGWAEDHNPSNGQQEPWHWEGVYVPPSSYRDVTPTTPIEEDDMFSDADRLLLQNVENLLAREGGNGLRGDVAAVKEVADRIDGNVGTVANELRAGHVEVLQALAGSGKGLGAISDTDLARIAKVVNDEAARRLTS